MRKTRKRSLKHFEDAALTNQEAHQVDGSLSFNDQLFMISEDLGHTLEANSSCQVSMFNAIFSYISKFTNLYCYGNINGLQD